MVDSEKSLEGRERKELPSRMSNSNLRRMSLMIINFIREEDDRMMVIVTRMMRVGDDVQEVTFERPPLINQLY